VVIVFGKTGQLCNRLFNLSSFITNSIENKYKMKILYFNEYYFYFENINNKIEPYEIEFLFENTIIGKINYMVKNNQRRISRLLKIFGVYYDKTGNINQINFIRSAQQNKVYVTGWPYWDVENFIKHSDLLRFIFTPTDGVMEKCNRIIDDSKQKSDILVGVHIRHGDYKEYMDGKYYFEADDYCRIIRNFNMNLLNNGYNPLFIICSNGKIDFAKEDFKFYISKNNAIEDIYLLSKCNYILGPPSTFSMWSSFYGKVPLKVLFHKNEVIKIEDFSEIIAPNTFKNGVNISKL
jgi:hypothetical protein